MGITQEQFDAVREIFLEDLEALPEILSGGDEEKADLVRLTIGQVKETVTRHGRNAGYNNVIKAWNGQTPKALAKQSAEVTVTTGRLAGNYTPGENPKSVLAEGAA